MFKQFIGSDPKMNKKNEIELKMKQLEKTENNKKSIHAKIFKYLEVRSKRKMSMDEALRGSY